MIELTDKEKEMCINWGEMSDDEFDELLDRCDIKKYEELPKRMGHRKQVWVNNPDPICEPGYAINKLCLRTHCRWGCKRPKKRRGRCGFKQAK